MTSVFLHGLDSSSKGTKATFFKKNFPDMMVPDFVGDLAQRMAMLERLLTGVSDMILVGSSFGGLMAANFALQHERRVRKLVLLAPALNFPGFSNYTGRRIATPVWLFIGSNDTVTPADLVLPAARRVFTDLHAKTVNDDHQLTATFEKLDWHALLNG